MCPTCSRSARRPLAPDSPPRAPPPPPHERHDNKYYDKYEREPTKNAEDDMARIRV